MNGLRVLAVDDEPPALDELAYLLGSDPRIGGVGTAKDGADALRHVDRALSEGRPIDAVFLDIKMPGLDGVELGRLLARFARPPQIVYVTGYEEYAVDAFEIRATDYLLKPIRPERMAEAIRRVALSAGGDPAGEPVAETVPVELAGVTRFVAVVDVWHVEAWGDYARLHTATGSHLVRIPLTSLEQRWRSAGFVRVHRSHLVALRHIEELRLESGRCTVFVKGVELPVSRRHTRELRDLLMRNAGQIP